MSTKIEKIYDSKNSEIKIIVPIDKKVWKEEQKKAFDRISKKIKIKGYRPGKAPIEVLKKNISDTNVWEEAASKLLNVAVADAAKQIDEKKDVVLDSPTYTIDKVSNDELEITFIYPVFPEMEIKNYDKIKVDFKLPTEKEIKEDAKKHLNDLQSRGTLLLPKEGKDAIIEDGDTIILDFKGFMGDEAFEGGEAKQYELKIGSNSFIPGFEDQLIGKKLGWEGSINVKFPETYYKEEFRNKDAKFEIKIHEIKYNDKQKLTEDFIKSLNIKDVKNEKELVDYLEDLSKREMIEKNRMKFMDDFVQEVIKTNEIPAPRAIVLKELQALMKKFEENLKAQGLSKKDYYDITGYTDDKVKEELKVEANKSVQKSVVYSLLSKQLKIKPTEEDFNRQYQRIGKLYNIDPQIAYQMIKKEQIEPTLINELLIDKLISLSNPSVKIEKEKVTFKPEEIKKNDVKLENNKKEEK